MASPKLIVLVRVRSSLPEDEALRVMEERAPQFRALGGLHQKYYLQNKQSGEFVGLYLWDSEEDFAAFRESALRATIAESYKTVGEPSVEVYDVVGILRSPD